MPTLPCPAKINLYLEVRGRRDDGFHELGTLFQAVEAGDVLHAEPWDDIALSGAEGVTNDPNDNLVIRAARLLKTRHPERVAANAGIRFTLDKHLPSGAGLGGGSSDAAAALRLASSLWNMGLADIDLRTLGAELGSDVPFFLGPPTAFGEGRGERLDPAPPPPPFHVVIATPNCHVATPWAYRELAARRGGIFGDTWREFRRDYALRHDDPAFFTGLRNDFEEPVLGHFPEIRAVREVLETFAPVKALLSGSGASVFALFDASDGDVAARALSAVTPSCRFAVKTRFLGAG